MPRKISIEHLQDICGEYSNNGDDCFFFGSQQTRPCRVENCPMGSCFDSDFRAAGEDPQQGYLMVDEKMLPEP